MIGRRTADAIRQRAYPEKVNRELERLGVEQSVYNKWSRGKCNPSAWHLREMARLGYDVAGILLGEDTVREEIHIVRCARCRKQEQNKEDKRLGVVWCCRMKTHMPEDGYCCYGQREE